MGIRKQESPGVEKTGKKTYSRPSLIVYGDIREVTKTFATPSGNVDMTGFPFKTNPMA